MSARPDYDYVHDYVDEVLRTGLMLSNLLGNLVDGLPDDAYPGETPSLVVFEMMVGTIRRAAAAAGEDAVRTATALLAATRDCTLTDLRAAHAIARRLQARRKRPRRPPAGP